MKHNPAKFIKKSKKNEKKCALFGQLTLTSALLRFILFA